MTITKNLIIIGIAILLICVGLSGCFGYGQVIKAEKIDEKRDDFYNITEQHFDLFPLIIQNMFNNSDNQVNLTFENLQTFMNITKIAFHIKSSPLEEIEYYFWSGYLSYQGMIYYLETDNFDNYYSYKFLIVKLVDMSVNISEQQMEQFPHLKDAIESENTNIGTPRDEFDALRDFLDDTLVDLNNIDGFVKYQNEYYQINLDFSG